MPEANRRKRAALDRAMLMADEIVRDLFSDDHGRRRAVRLLRIARDGEDLGPWSPDAFQALAFTRIAGAAEVAHAR
jgi:hypothetical protein